MPKVSVVIPIYNLEKYIHAMLVSVQNQTFKDFEVIMVDDGSKDNSAGIARAFLEDSRFRLVSQENCGVSAARNKGMDNACGDYIIFFDGDDFVPAESLEHLYSAITESDSEMSVGVMKTYNDGVMTVNAPTKKLAAKKEIACSDINFIKTWSQCNKMYRLDFLKRNGIRFTDARVAEDGHFLYQVLAAKPAICGCGHDVYHYFRRPFWDGEYTASKNVGIAYLNDRLSVYEDMQKYSEKILAGCSDKEKELYYDELFTRFIKGGLVQAFYKRIWRCDDSVAERLPGALNMFKNQISPKGWRKIDSEEWEIRIDERVEDSADNSFKNQCIADPVVSVIITGDMEETELSLTMHSLYNQEFPAFEVLINGKLHEKLDEKLRSRENLRVISGGSIKKYIENSRGEYIQIIDRPVILSTHALKKMCNICRKNPDTDFVSAYVRGMNLNRMAEKTFDINAMNAVFGYRTQGRTGKRKVNYLDCFLMNKLIRKSVIEEIDTDKSSGEITKRLYDGVNFEKTRSAWVLAGIDDAGVLDQSAVRVAKPVIWFNLMKNRMVAYILKNNNTKSIVKKLVKR